MRTAEAQELAAQRTVMQQQARVAQQVSNHTILCAELHVLHEYM